ncbi:hypothetical protein JG688_00012603 [Phytophthora aleatoria]|uniref:Uncharacterized protein n=1 Tax=Phytophthora aleatoria TaxID=2496075 RepID=A0A8J5IIZ1_9STRA|nr:hypothetical protein JG688_00012603 [Phytophthora aleatoria]
MASDDTGIPANDAVEYVYTPSDDEHNNDDDDASGGLIIDLLVNSGDSLNSVADGDTTPQFGSMDSGDEAEKDDVEIEEYSSDEALKVTVIPKTLFGGEDEVLAGNLKKIVLPELSATGWEDVIEPDVYDYLMTPYEPVDDTGSYLALRQGYSGPSAGALRRGDSPVALFFFFMPVAL